MIPSRQTYRKSRQFDHNATFSLRTGFRNRGQICFGEDGLEVSDGGGSEGEGEGEGGRGRGGRGGRGGGRGGDRGSRVPPSTTTLRPTTTTCIPWSKYRSLQQELAKISDQIPPAWTESRFFANLSNTGVFCLRCVLCVVMVMSDTWWTCFVLQKTVMTSNGVKVS